MRILRNTDVNTDGGSSTPSTGESASPEVVKETTASTSVETPSDQPKDFESAVEAGFKATSAEKEPEEESEKSEEQVETKEEPKVEDKGPIPYERFAEVNKAKVEAEQLIESQKEAVSAYNKIEEFCNTHGIAPEDFSYWLNVAALTKNDPAKAMEMLNPKVQELQSFKGEILSPELQSAVENGEMSLEWAKKLAAAENQQKFSQRQTKFTQEQVEQQRQQKFMQDVQTSFDSWAHSKLTNDPDFKPKSGANARDGKFEFVLHKIGAEWQKAGIKTPQDLTAFAEKCYQEINGSVSAFGGTKKTPTIVRSNQSTSAAQGEPKTMDDAINRAFLKAGVAVN